MNQLETIQSKIFEIRGHKVMVDYDLAILYGVQTKNLNLAVKRNIKRFPEDFMFQLTKAEWDRLRLQIATSNNRGGTRYLPYAFTEQGLSMLSSVIHSDEAIEVNISIMRTFVLIRQFAMNHKELARKIKAMEQKYNKQFKDIYEAMQYLLQKDTLEEQQGNRKKIGFKIQK